MGKILARYVHEKPVPGKLFLFDTGVEIFGDTLDQQVENARLYARIQLEAPVTNSDVPIWQSKVTQLEGAVFTLGMIWGELDREGRMIDLYGYKGLDGSSVGSWRNSNPEVTMWTLFALRDSDVALWARGFMASCETSLIVLGKEAEHRRTTLDLKDYMRSHAYLAEMDPPPEYRYLRI